MRVIRYDEADRRSGGKSRGSRGEAWLCQLCAGQTQDESQRIQEVRKSITKDDSKCRVKECYLLISFVFVNLFFVVLQKSTIIILNERATSRDFRTACKCETRISNHRYGTESKSQSYESWEENRNE